jgi:predicted Zn-dependent peptidase
MQIFVMERKDLPKVAAVLTTRAGSGRDPQGKEGLAALSLQIMRRGSKSRKAIEIDQTLGDLGTNLAFSANPETVVMRIEALRRNLPASLEVVADIARNPSFPADEVEREKKKRLDVLAQAYNNPNNIASRIAPALAFGPNHPYGRPVQGFPSTVGSITVEDLTRFHSSYWKPGSSALILAGDISLAEAKEMAQRSFGSWSGAATPSLAVPPPKPMGPGKVFLVNRPDAAQTVVTEILPGPAREATDFYALSLADTVWGGGAAARLGMNIREDKGYSYGVFSGTDAHSQYGMWTASGGVQTNKTKESLVEFQKELKFIAGQKPVSEKELVDARNQRVRGYAQQFESLDRVVGQLQTLWTTGLPMTELQRQSIELQRATLPAVNAAAEKYATPSRATLLLVGDLSKIETGVRELDLGEVVIIDPEGKPARN